MKYNVQQDLSKVLDYMTRRGLDFNQLFSPDGGHPPPETYIREEIQLETIIILDMASGLW